MGLTSSTAALCIWCGVVSCLRPNSSCVSASQSLIPFGAADGAADAGAADARSAVASISRATNGDILSSAHVRPDCSCGWTVRAEGVRPNGVFIRRRHGSGVQNILPVTAAHRTSCLSQRHTGPLSVTVSHTAVTCRAAAPSALANGVGVGAGGAAEYR